MTFLEISDQAEGRKVVMVCKDGVTFWDVLDAKGVTPLVVHPTMEPKELGTLITYRDENGLKPALDAVIAFMRDQGNVRLDNDPLFVFRVLWFIRGRATCDNATPSAETIQWAIEQTLAQEDKLLRNHGVIERYVTSAPKQ